MEKSYEYGETRENCTYNLVVESCKQCLFETLCRLKKQKALDHNASEGR